MQAALAEFDIGVLMGTQSPTIFNEYVAMHQGAQRLRALWVKECNCNKPDCFRTGFQQISWQVSDDPDLMLRFLDRLKGFEPLTEAEFDVALDKLYDEANAKYGCVKDCRDCSPVSYMVH